MRAPAAFPRAASASVALMAAAYGALASAGYSSRGAHAADPGSGGLIVFSLGHAPALRAAAGAVLLQALSQYLVSLVIWAHNLLTLLSRVAAGRERGRGGERAPPPTAAPLLLPGEGGGEAGGATTAPRPGRDHHYHHHHHHHGPRRPQDHGRGAWAGVTAAVALASWGAASSPVSFSALVALVTAATYLLVAYGIPAWCALALLGPRARADGGPAFRGEVWVWRGMVGGSILLSAGGLAASAVAAVRGEGGGPA